MLWGLICFVHPSQPLEEENNLEVWGARVIKLSRVWIICPSTVRERGLPEDASILCRKNGKITYIEYTSNSVLIFCFLCYISTCHPKVRWHLATFLRWTWTLDLTKLLSNELVAENAVFFQRLFAWLATWLCFYMDSCCICNSACFHNAFSPVVRIASVFPCFLLLMHNAPCFHSAFSPVTRISCVFTRILASNAMLCVFIEPF